MNIHEWLYDKSDSIVPIQLPPAYYSNDILFMPNEKKLGTRIAKRKSMVGMKVYAHKRTGVMMVRIRGGRDWTHVGYYLGNQKAKIV